MLIFVNFLKILNISTKELNLDYQQLVGKNYKKLKVIFINLHEIVKNHKMIVQLS